MKKNDKPQMAKKQKILKMATKIEFFLQILKVDLFTIDKGLHTNA